ncbi:MAG: hypothetical protein CR968_01420 [Flavobacteriia bacterium]|nr:MAG: hypothetical protein CR968_01420 [Flavobacteriia bacterium]
MAKSHINRLTVLRRIGLTLVMLLFITISTYAQDEKKYTTHIVKEGETLRKIAKKYNTRVRIIKNLNPDVKRNRVKPNVTLVVPRITTGKKGSHKLDTAVASRQKHTVVEGETLFSIAKTYNVTLQSLREINKLQNNDLSIGQVLTIPSVGDFTAQSESGNDGLVMYEVKKGDTKYNLSKRFDISIENIESLNPQLKNEKLKRGSSIWLPYSAVNKDIANAPASSSDTEEPFVYHQYKKGDDLFRIAVIYGTTVEAIKARNPENFKKLRPGMLLKIPGKKKI